MAEYDLGNGRDRRGRWKKGFCPNKSGRPRKQPEISESDVGYFKQTLVEATINGEKRRVTRHELLLHSMFDQALKGKTSIARKLFERFEDVDLTFAKAYDRLREMRDAFLTRYYETGEHDEKLANEILELQKMLHYGSELKPPRKPRIKWPRGAPTWRKGPKPEAILEMEAEWAEAERLSPPDPTDDD